MTLDDVVVRSGVLFVVLIAGAFAGWQLVERAAWVVWVCAIIAFGLALAATFTREAKPALILLYAVFEGLFLGGISRWYDVYVAAVKGTQTGIVMQAIIGTLVAFGVMLALYSSGRLRATPRFQKILTVALVSYLGIGLVSFIAAIFGVGGGWGFYGVGTLGLAAPLYTLGIQHSNPVTAAILSASSPVVTAFVGWVAYRLPVPRHMIPGILLTILGCAYATYDPSLPGTPFDLRGGELFIIARRPAGPGIRSPRSAGCWVARRSASPP